MQQVELRYVTRPFLTQQLKGLAMPVLITQELPNSTLCWLNSERVRHYQV